MDTRAIRRLVALHKVNGITFKYEKGRDGVFTKISEKLHNLGITVVPGNIIIPSANYVHRYNYCKWLVYGMRDGSEAIVFSYVGMKRLCRSNIGLVHIKDNIFEVREEYAEEI